MNVDKAFKPTLRQHSGSGPKVSAAKALMSSWRKSCRTGAGCASRLSNTVAAIWGAMSAVILDEPFGNVDTRWRKRPLDLLQQDQ